MKKILLVSVLFSGVCLWAGEDSGLSANLGVVTDYVNRGLSATDGGPALQGGLDYAHEAGVYAGTWVSNVDNDGDTEYEYDLYAGFAREAGNFSYDVGILATHFTYEDGNTVELTLNAGFDAYGLTLYRTLAADDETLEGDNYLELGAEFEIPAIAANLALHAGYYAPAESLNDTLSDFSATLSKNDFAFAPDHEFGLTVSQFGKDLGDGEDDPRTLFFWTKEFSL